MKPDLLESLQQRIERFLRTEEGDFDALALELFRYQFALNKPYQAYCQAQGVVPEAIQQWQDIPPVPIQAFKSAELATFPVGRAAAIFESSATTTGTPSRHYLKTLTYYETALKTGFKRMLFQKGGLEQAEQGEPAHQKSERHLSDFWSASFLALPALSPFFILTPPPAEAPRSSLTWMLDVLKRTWGGPASDYFIQRGRLDEPRLSRCLRKAEESGQPVVLLGTTLAFLNYFDYAAKNNQTYRLPLGSRLMDTGGMKTQKRDVERPKFVQQVGGMLAIPPEGCINEYGMCEMSSQFYGRGTSSYLEGPPWTRTLVIDRFSGRPAPEDTPGLLRHFDLANVDSVLAIQTDDIGIAQGSGFIFQGRDSAAAMKGCSLSAEALLK